jgi:uncharacterized protein YegP (UPF0339 family)
MANKTRVDWVDIYEDDSGEWRWRAKSANGKTVADSGEGYMRQTYVEEAVADLFPETEIHILVKDNPEK